MYDALGKKIVQLHILGLMYSSRVLALMAYDLNYWFKNPAQVYIIAEGMRNE